MNVIVSGAFDDIKSPDVRFLQEASKHGPVTVLLWTDSLFQKINGRAPKFPQQERKYFIENLRYVTEVHLINQLDSINTLPPEFLASGSIWVVRETEHHPEKERFAISHKITYLVIPTSQLAGFPNPIPSPQPNPTRKKVIVTGCYDWLHSGHIRFFEEASTYGDLYVGIGSDENIKALKGQGHPMFPQEERLYMVASVKHVYHAFINSGFGWLDAEPDILRIKPDFYIVNEDGDRGGKKEFCEKHGITYIVLKRAPAPGLPRRSSTELRGF